MEPNESNIPHQPHTEPSPFEKLIRAFWEVIKVVALTLIIIIPIRLWVTQPFFVSGASMEPTFDDGDYLVIDEFSYHFREPQRGEVIVFRFPGDERQFYIKRIIGLPGEKVEIQDG
jgi:signal peptidase I